jgi:hypothetical protein
MRPFLTVWEDVRLGQVGMEAEQRQTLLLYHYIFSTTKKTYKIFFPKQKAPLFLGALFVNQKLKLSR